MFFQRNNFVNIPKKGMVNALGAFAYVTAIALFIASLQNPNSPDSPAIKIMAPIGMLMLLVLSATVMGLLIFGAPVMLYVDGKKKEAVQLVSWTVASLAVITACMLAVMAYVSA